MELNIIKKLIALLEESNLKKLHLRDGEFEISIEKEDKHIKHKVHEHKLLRQEELVKEEEIKNDKEGLDYIVSPMVGTFYASPSPDQPAFIKVGDEVSEDTIIGIIEAMKVMNEVKAGKKGKIVNILSKNAEPVEFGSKLFSIES